MTPRAVRTAWLLALWILARRLQLRWEIYNVANTANFVPPNSALGNPQFGRITSTGNSIARQMQFGARFSF